MKYLAHAFASATLALAVGLPASVSAETLKASHQWPGGQGDIRDEMVQMIAREVNGADLGIDIKVFPGASLYKPKEQWNAVAEGQLAITALPLAYAGGQHPEFNLTLMPGLVKNHDHARRLNNSEFMKRIKQIMSDNGVIVLADTWLAGGFVSKKACVLDPDDVKGQQFRAAGKSFEQMLAGAGASIASMPSSEIYSALQTGVLDAALTSSASLVSYRIYEQVTCLTAPGDNALWVMYEPILMSKKVFDGLTKEQQDAIMAAAEKAEEYAYKGAIAADEELVKVYKEHDIEVVTMTAEQAAAWRTIADETSYKAFADSVPGGRELLDLALSVD